MRTNKFLGRDWLSPEIDYTKEEWESLLRLDRRIENALMQSMKTHPTS